MRGPVTKDSRLWRIFLSSHSIAYLYTFHCLSNCYTWVRKAVVYQGTESPFSHSSMSRDHSQLRFEESQIVERNISSKDDIVADVACI
jgi:hypothetical protein